MRKEEMDRGIGPVVDDGDKMDKSHGRKPGGATNNNGESQQQ